jgi:hypothetical protein
MSTGLQIAVALLFLLPSMATAARAAIADTMQLSPQLHTRPVYAADFSMSKVRLLEDSSKALKAANTYDAGTMPANYSYYGNLAFERHSNYRSESPRNGKCNNKNGDND